MSSLTTIKDTRLAIRPSQTTTKVMLLTTKVTNRTIKASNPTTKAINPATKASSPTTKDISLQMIKAFPLRQVDSTALSAQGRLKVSPRRLQEA
jgi:hypothetical protein